MGAPTTRIFAALRDADPIARIVAAGFIGRPPETHEGIACFQRRGRVYLTSSMMTGYFPNPSSIAVAKSYHGPFSTIGDLHPTDLSRTSFGSQISSIFKHPGKSDLYIALADRWMPEISARSDYASGEISNRVRAAIATATSTPRPPLSEAEREAIAIHGTVTRMNTSVSRYVWLPLTFDGDRPTIAWRDEWRIEDFR